VSSGNISFPKFNRAIRNFGASSPIQIQSFDSLQREADSKWHDLACAKLAIPRVEETERISVAEVNE